MQINALGTLLSTVFPAFLPRCHHYIEQGSRILPSSEHEKFMIVSLDGFLRCIDDCRGDCVNRLALPTGNIALEIKCPFSPIDNKLLLPVNYSCPHYYASQVLSEMKVLDSMHSMVVSCSPQSLTMSYLDWDDDMWKKLWELALHCYNHENPTIPVQLSAESKNLHQVIKDFVEQQSVVALEVPALECIDSKAYEKFTNEDNPIYRYRDKYPALNVDVEEVREHVLNCCKSTMVAVQEAHDLQ